MITLSPQASGTALPPAASPTWTATPLGEIIPISPVPDVLIVTATPFPGAPSPMMEGSTALPPTLGSPVPEVPNLAVEAEVVPSPVPAPLLPPDAAEVLSFDPGEVAALAWSPDGQTLAAAYADRISLQNMADLTTPEIELKQAGATALAFSADGRWLASAHQDGTVSLWDPLYSQGELVAMLTVSQVPLVKVSFSPDGTYLILEAENGAITLWSLSLPGPTLSTVPPREGEVVSLWGCSTTFNGGTAPQSRPLDEYTITSTPDTHDGIDLAAPNGTTVLAAGAGTVVFAGWSDTGRGYTVVIAHGETFSLYAHLEKIVVECGQKVSEGEQIGTVGSTGNASGPMLHFEIRDAAWTPLDPNRFIAF
jgi:murein DD-endopeptidase MepM/ murein hydrolase activator NlpD